MPAEESPDRLRMNAPNNFPSFGISDGCPIPALGSVVNPGIELPEHVHFFRYIRDVSGLHEAECRLCRRVILLLRWPAWEDVLP